MRFFLGEIGFVLGVACVFFIVVQPSLGDRYEKLAEILQKKCPNSEDLGRNLRTAELVHKQWEKEWFEADISLAREKRIPIQTTERPTGCFSGFATKKKKKQQQQYTELDSYESKRLELENKQLHVERLRSLMDAAEEFIGFAKIEKRIMCTDNEKKWVEDFSYSIKADREREGFSPNRLDKLVAVREQQLAEPECKLARDLKAKYSSLDWKSILKVERVSDSIYYEFFLKNSESTVSDTVGNIYSKCIKRGDNKPLSSLWSPASWRVAFETVKNFNDYSDAEESGQPEGIKLNLVKLCEYYIDQMADIVDEAESIELEPSAEANDEPRIAVRDLYLVWCRVELCKTIIAQQN